MCDAIWDIAFFLNKMTYTLSITHDAFKNPGSKDGQVNFFDARFRIIDNMTKNIGETGTMTNAKK